MKKKVQRHVGDRNITAKHKTLFRTVRLFNVETKSFFTSKRTQGLNGYDTLKT